MLTAKNGKFLGLTDFEQVADYLNDLNAMHEAEKVRFSDNEDELTLNEWAYNLYVVTRGNAEDKDVALARATAAQRTEAFLRTLNLWT